MPKIGCPFKTWLCLAGLWKAGILLALSLTLPCVGDRAPGDKQYWAVHCRCGTLSGGWVHQVGIHGDMGPLSGLCAPHPQNLLL